MEAKRSGAAKTTVAVPSADGFERGLVVLARREHHRGVAEVGEPLALVAHQRDQRRDDDGQVVARERGELVAEALAAAGGHDDERVAAVERGLHRLALAGRKVEAEQGEGLGVASGAGAERGASGGGWTGERAGRAAVGVRAAVAGSGWLGAGGRRRSGVRSAGPRCGGAAQ